MSYNLKIPSPWQPGYALPDYISEHSPIVYPDWSPNMFPLGAVQTAAEIRDALTGGRVHTGVMQAKMTWPLPQGPRMLVGPFNFSATKPSHLKITQQQFGSRDGMAIQAFVGQMLGQVTAKTRYLCTQGSPMPLWWGQRCMKDYKGWSVDTLMPINLWDGKLPIAVSQPKATAEQLEQAKTNQELGKQIGCLYNAQGKLIGCRKFKPWGLYAKFEKGSVRFTFKPIETGLFDRIFGLVAGVVSTLITSIAEVLEYALDLMKDLACAAAEPAMKQLMAYATGSISLGVPPTKPAGMSAEEYANQRKGWDAVKQAGIPNSEVAKLRGKADSELVAAVSNRVKKAFCGGGNVIPPVASSTPGWLLPVAIVGGVGAAAFFLTR